MYAICKYLNMLFKSELTVQSPRWAYLKFSRSFCAYQ